jgi:hypothetical protein
MKPMLVLVMACAFSVAAAAATVPASPHVAAAVVKGFGDPPAAVHCLEVLVSASNPDYAAVTFDPKRCNRFTFNGVNVLHRAAVGDWRVVFEASEYRCPIPQIPKAVQRDLHICPYKAR